MKGIFVSPGEEVIPGQPLGIIGGENYKQVPICVSVFIAPCHIVINHDDLLPCYYAEGLKGTP